jgi:hypothetical protein
MNRRVLLPRFLLPLKLDQRVDQVKRLEQGAELTARHLLIPRPLSPPLLGVLFTLILRTMSFPAPSKELLCHACAVHM